jgi:hypothetical protein
MVEEESSQRLQAVSIAGPGIWSETRQVFLLKEFKELSDRNRSG